MSVLLGMQYEYPRGQIIATCRLVDCVPSEAFLGDERCDRCDKGVVILYQDGMPGGEYCCRCDGNGYISIPGGKLSAQERGYGDYTEGRFVWLLDEIQSIVPIPAKGALGLWEWEPAG